MRTEKLDPALHAALSTPTCGGAAVLHLVFVETELYLPDSARGILESVEARLVAPSSGLFTAALTGGEIDRLSEENWVRRLRLSRELRPA